MIREVPGGITLAVRAQPGAKKTAIVGLYGEGESAQLKIAVQAPPVEGRANQALIVFLAETFAISRGSVELISGELSRSKVFGLRGVSLTSPIPCWLNGCRSSERCQATAFGDHHRPRGNAAPSASFGSGRTRKSACASANTTRPSRAIT